VLAGNRSNRAAADRRSRAKLIFRCSVSNIETLITKFLGQGKISQRSIVLVGNCSSHFKNIFGRNRSGRGGNSGGGRLAGRS